MLTRLRFKPPEWRDGGDVNELGRAISQYLLSLEGKGALEITVARIDSTPIGANDPSTGKFTTLEATATATVNGTAATLLRFGQKVGAATVSDYGGCAYHVYSATADQSAVVDFNRSRHTTVGSHTPVQADDTLGYLIFRGSDGGAFQNAALIKVLVDGAVSGADMPGRIEFHTSPDGTAAPVSRLVIKSDGRIYGTALHNNAGDVTGTTTQYIASGTYTPTLTNISNLDASTSAGCQWMRVGNVVTVSGVIQANPTATGLTELGVSLPIASNFSAGIVRECAGVGDFNGVDLVYIRGDGANDRAKFTWSSGVTANVNLGFHFTYLIS